MGRRYRCFILSRAANLGVVFTKWLPATDPHPNWEKQCSSHTSAPFAALPWLTSVSLCLLLLFPRQTYQLCLLFFLFFFTPPPGPGWMFWVQIWGWWASSSFLQPDVMPQCIPFCHPPCWVALVLLYWFQTMEKLGFEACFSSTTLTLCNRLLKHFMTAFKNSCHKFQHMPHLGITSDHLFSFELWFSLLLVWQVIFSCTLDILLLYQETLGLI